MKKAVYSEKSRREKVRIPSMNEKKIAKVMEFARFWIFTSSSS